jgi:hypothetical protein
MILTEALRQFLDTSVPFLAGSGGVNAMAIGMRLTRGLAFPLRAGAIILARRRLYPTPDERWLVCGMAQPGTGTIRNFPGFGHEPSMGFQYTAGRTDGNGYLSEYVEPTRLDFDAAGDLISPRLPMWPTEVRAIPIAAGKFRVSWVYEPYGQGAEPAVFRVHVGTSPAGIVWATAAAAFPAVTHVPGRRAYVVDSTSGESHGTILYFGVRARNSAGVAEQNTYGVGPVTARTTAPPAATISAIRTAHAKG